MLRSRLSSALAAVFSLCILAVPAAAATLPNGDFSDGFSGWTVTSSANGQSTRVEVQSFETVAGVSSEAALFQVGRVAPSGSGGVTLSQSVAIAADGIFSFSADIAAVALNVGNASGGIFRLLVNGIALDRHDFGSIDGASVERARLSGSISLSAGVAAVVAIEIQRPFSAGLNSPRQYVDNVATDAPLVIETAAVPAPPAALLLLAGIGGLAAARRRAA